MKIILTILDPETYGLSRTACALGICALATAAVICTKLLAVLHAAQQ